MGTIMFFIAKCTFWLSVVALAMPGAEVEAGRTGGAVTSIASIAALAAPTAAALGEKCLAVDKCRDALTALVRKSLEEDQLDAVPEAPRSAKGKPAQQKTAAARAVKAAS